MILANQFTQQIPEDILAALLGNVGSIIAFQLGATDAEIFETQLENKVLAHNFTSIPKYHAYCRTQICGMPSDV